MLPTVGRTRLRSQHCSRSLELDGILQQLYAELMKCDGEEYEPESLKIMQAALDRGLREEGYSYSILKDAEFSQ